MRAGFKADGVRRERVWGVLALLLILAGCNAPSPAEVNRQETGGETAGEIPKDRSGLIRHIEKLVEAGDVESTTKAIVLINERFSTEEIREDATVRRLLDAAIAADKASNSTEQGAEYAERVESVWLPMLKKIDMAEPTTAPALWQRVSAIEEVVRGLNDGSEFREGAAGKARMKLASAIRSKQVDMFPVLRRAYGKITREVMWPADVEVATSGAGSRTITFTGAHFAANRNIGSAQETVRPFLQKLRFSKSSYEWVRNGEGYSYELLSPTDRDIGTWEGGRFSQITD